MKDRNYLRFMSDVRRYRPVMSIAASALVMVPNFHSLVAQELTTTEFLERFAESFAIVSVLVWAGTAVVLHYALEQARSQLRQRQESEIDA